MFSSPTVESPATREPINGSPAKSIKPLPLSQNPWACVSVRRRSFYRRNGPLNQSNAAPVDTKRSSPIRPGTLETKLLLPCTNTRANVQLTESIDKQRSSLDTCLAEAADSKQKAPCTIHTSDDPTQVWQLAEVQRERIPAHHQKCPLQPLRAVARFAGSRACHRHHLNPGNGTIANGAPGSQKEAS